MSIEHVVDIEENPWWSDHLNLSMVAEFLHNEGQDVTEIIYMLEKPWKYTEEYEYVVKEK